jgi:CheY-like chemotaxis protein
MKNPEKNSCDQNRAPPYNRDEPLRVLVVDDNETNHEFVKRILYKHRCQIITARNGCEALEVLQKSGFDFDLVLMDLQMPVMGGLEATSAVRSLEATLGQHLLIIGFSSSSSEEQGERCLKAGMDGFLSKPVKPNELLALVEQAAARNKPNCF